MGHRNLVVHTVIGAAVIFLAGCGTATQDYIDVTAPVSASALVLSAEHPGNGFLIDRKERFLLTTQRVVNQRGEIEVVFPVIEQGKALVQRSTWLARAKSSRTTKGRVLITSESRDLALIELQSVPDGVIELKLAKDSPGKDTPVQFLGAADRNDLVWAPASSKIRKIGLMEVTFENNQTVSNQMFGLEVSGQRAKGVSGGAVVNENNEVVGVIASDAAQRGPMRCTDLSEIRVVLAAAYRVRAMAAYDQKKYDTALAYSDRALEVCDADALGYNERGAAYSQKDLFDKALADYSKAIALEPRFALAYRNRGSSYLHLGKVKEAIADCSKAIEIAPKYQSPYLTRIQAYTKLKMTKEAEADRLKLAELKQEESKQNENKPAPKWSVVSGGVSKASPTSSGNNPYSGTNGRNIVVSGSGGC